MRILSLDSHSIKPLKCVFCFVLSRIEFSEQTVFPFLKIYENTHENSLIMAQCCTDWFEVFTNSFSKDGSRVLVWWNFDLYFVSEVYIMPKNVSFSSPLKFIASEIFKFYHTSGYLGDILWEYIAKNIISARFEHTCYSNVCILMP